VIRLANPASLRRHGILGMNRRNVDFISPYNPRRNYPLVDNKLLTKKAALARSIPVPQLIGTVHYQYQVAKAINMLAPYQGFVIKPAQGILVVIGRHGDTFVKSSGAEIGPPEIMRHITNILAGLHSLGGRNDVAMIETLIEFDPVLADYSYEGVPDIRVIAFRGVPVMAMMRCATHASDGKANLHQGAVGVGLDIGDGSSVAAVQRGALVSEHPDTGASFGTLSVPHWDRILDLAASCVEMVGIQYLGADIVLDRGRGPMLLELNARPGLAIQVANQAGLCHRLQAAAEIADSTDDHHSKIALARARFGAAKAPAA
jgi:alpha-L-glutamate ligase-like protein